jgi:hypothetical protein
MTQVFCRAPMTVHCEGDCHIVEQIGEKQDFETELTRLGFRHEDFTLQVASASKGGSRWARQQNYSVTVANVVTDQQRVYQGGPRREWVKECAADLAKGAFGEPLQKN